MVKKSIRSLRVVVKFYICRELSVVLTNAFPGIGDEIDLIKNDSPVNPAHIVIARVEILSAVPRKDLEGIKVTMKRFRNLTIEKYDN